MASRLVRINAVTANDVLDGAQAAGDRPCRPGLSDLVGPEPSGGRSGAQVVSFLTAHEQNLIPSPALLERRGQAFRRADVRA